jgi:hypothetical protein
LAPRPRVAGDRRDRAERRSHGAVAAPRELHARERGSRSRPRAVRCPPTCRSSSRSTIAPASSAPSVVRSCSSPWRSRRASR